MTDPAAEAARAAAAILACELGAGLPAEVEATLAARDAVAARNARQRPNVYLDPVSIGSLIVSIAALAWTVYNDLCDRHPSPPSDAVAHQVRITLRERDTVLPEGAERITEIVATEITRHNSSPQ